MSDATFRCEYDPQDNIVFVTFPQVHLETRDQIRNHFDSVVRYWREHCGGNRVYWVVNYDGFSVNLRENDYYAEQMKRVIATALTVVRYGGDPLQRTGARLYNMKLHEPTRLYESRDAAIAVVRDLRSGRMTIADGRG